MNRIRSHVIYPAKPKPEPKPPANRNAWSDEDDAKIKQFCPVMTWAAVGAMLGRSRHAVRVRAGKFGITKGDGND